MKRAAPGLRPFRPSSKWVYLKKAQLSADASSELAKRLGDTGALPKAAQAREQAFYAELTGQLAEAQLSARLAKEQLTRLMGVWGTEIEYFVPDRLPALPAKPLIKDRIEADALKQRVDLKAAKLNLEGSPRATDSRRPRDMSLTLSSLLGSRRSARPKRSTNCIMASLKSRPRRALS